MPIYEFECMDCGNEFERLMPMTKVDVDSSCPPCPRCKSRTVSRVMSKLGGFIFKGPGFYATDYKMRGK